jgi:hypothetical protein
MKWSELRKRVATIHESGDVGKALAPLLSDLDAASPAMEENERIVEAVMRWTQTTDPVEMFDLAGWIQKLAAERAKGASDA